jgi:hypothetical protein
MSDMENEQAKLAVLVKQAQEAFSPVLHKEHYTQLAKEYKIKYDCFRAQGFTVREALRLAVGIYE